VTVELINLFFLRLKKSDYKYTIQSLSKKNTRYASTFYICCSFGIHSIDSQYSYVNSFSFVLLLIYEFNRSGRRWSRLSNTME